ncbi:muscular LMNA-interacting protein isoform X2 [Sphaerodactylus townsendi]|uniref:muscular LMNA-interacting protein isoform X2 n=1 Tax=Sphaerodactylus townsendi TaxID=933632 RepID=UPI002026C7DB|nr:muscular LMNA-interacting protein isoform X2 [Sphaerodactylus townsendi]
MELGNHERETSARDTLWKEKLKPTENGEPTEKTAVKESSFLRFLSREKVPSESGFLRFTFVPSFGRLPSQFHVADATSFLVSVSEEPLEKKNQEIKNTTELVAEGQTIESGPKRKSEASGCTKDNQKNLQPPECKASKRKMDKDDLFQADFVFVTDSDEDKMAMASNGYGHARAHILDTSCTSTSSKSRGNTSKPSDTELSDSSASQQKQCQLTSPLSTSGHLSHKSPVVNSLSPTNLKIEPDLASTVHQASSVQESHSQWQSANGSTTHQSSTYLQSTASFSVPVSILKRPLFPFNSLSDSVQSPCDIQASNLQKMAESTTSSLPSKYLPPTSQISSSSDTLPSSSPHTLSPPPSKRFNTLASLPIQITTHLLSPSPKPLSSPFHGSSSAISSVNNLYSQIPSKEKSEIRSTLPTRLSVLTAILKSGSSPKRPFSPASCPATFSPSSLGSSTLTIDQKCKTTPSTPKKLPSNYSVWSDKSGQDEYVLSVFTNVPNHMTSKSSPTFRARSTSPKSYLDADLPPEKLRPLSPTISTYRKTVVSPLLHPTICNSLPPHVPRNTSQITSKGAHSPAHRNRGPEKSKKVHTYSPTFTTKSYPVSTPANSQQGMFSTPSEKHSPLSLNFLQPSCKSKLPQVSAKNLKSHSPVPSPHWPLSLKDSTSSISTDDSVSTPSIQINSSSIHASYRACPSFSRPRAPLMQSRSPTRVRSPCSLLSSSRELTSPLPSDSKVTQPHKIKASYKAFAAIPTNTLLLEQKALNEPESEESSSDTHSEICSPAQLRQQTEELCAAIDEVLQEPLSKQQHDSSPSSLQKLLISDVGKTPITLQRPAGRETRFANLNLRTPTVNESKKTRPGVIRPTTVKAKIIFKKEDPIQPNPFKKYLEETTESQTEQPTHPIVPIPENEALSSKQLHSAGVQSQTDLLVHHENKDGSRGSFADNVLPHSRDPSLLRGDPGDYPAKPN